MTSWKLNLQNVTRKTDKGRTRNGQGTDKGWTRDGGTDKGGMDGVNPGGACFAVPKNDRLFSLVCKGGELVFVCYVN